MAAAGPEAQLLGPESAHRGDHTLLSRYFHQAGSLPAKAVGRRGVDLKAGPLVVEHGERRTRSRMAEIGAQRLAEAVKEKWEEVQT